MMTPDEAARLLWESSDESPLRQAIEVILAERAAMLDRYAEAVVRCAELERMLGVMT